MNKNVLLGVLALGANKVVIKLYFMQRKLYNLYLNFALGAKK